MSNTRNRFGCRKTQNKLHRIIAKCSRSLNCLCQKGVLFLEGRADKLFIQVCLLNVSGNGSKYSLKVKINNRSNKNSKQTFKCFINI